ncbi:MAG TPA: DUF434 domain-containing protein [Thermosulfurimonas dismutans]|uniref:DUF434 domain-containing protein n=1 Tax=Thermosulfurimonas dismutans TaxID=999894 RepID=A0A7C3CK34_9BACT|nr:DUF434 domain-containing protein [Thermosulfurimonas dismutans]
MNVKALREAARDLAFLLDRGYPERAALKLVGDRFGLSRAEREFLIRATPPREIALSRRQKRVRAAELSGKRVTVDGYNVLATLSHALSGRPLVLSRDGFVRDAERAYGRFPGLEIQLPRMENLILCFFRRYPPAFLGIYLDAPVSGSGKLAERLRRRILTPLGVPGEVLAVKEAERLVLSGEVVCTADGALIDRARRVFDLAGHLIRYSLRMAPERFFG